MPSWSPRRHAVGVLAAGTLVTAGTSLVYLPLAGAQGSTGRIPLASSPIRHVMVVYQENHSFDNVLGQLCQERVGATRRCDGATAGKLPSGADIPLRQASDLVPDVAHNVDSQQEALNGGRMNGFARLPGCTAASHYRCYTSFAPSQIPNLAALARRYTINDRTFELNPVPSFGAHVELVAAGLDGFTGANPPEANPNLPPGQPTRPGWGCDSLKDTRWQPENGSTVEHVPACIPDYRLSRPNGGAYRPTPVKHVSTIMDELDRAGLSWRLYTGGSEPTSSGRMSVKSWAICPTFADCWYTHQRQNEVAPAQILADARRGTLASFSVLLPDGVNGTTSQHNGYSMTVGDDWVGQSVRALMSGPEAASTAVFITYDDCGCFYDHVRPPAGMGVRVPMVVVSPWAKPHYTDSRAASIASLLAFTEHVFGLPPLTGKDAGAYDFAGSFDFSQSPVAVPQLVRENISTAESHYIASHGGAADDPT